MSRGTWRPPCPRSSLERCLVLFLSLSLPVLALVLLTMRVSLLFFYFLSAAWQLALQELGAEVQEKEYDVDYSLMTLRKISSNQHVR